MPILYPIQVPVVISSGGGNYTIDVADKSSYNPFSGTGNLSGNITISPTGIPLTNMICNILCDFSFVLGAYNISIFGYQLTQAQAQSKTIFQCYYDGSAWSILPIQEVKTKTTQGVNVRNDSPTFGSYTLTSGKDEAIQIVEGTFTLGANYQFSLAGSGNDGDTFSLIWNAACTRSGNNVTIFGVNCNQFVDNGQFSVNAFYTGASWKVSVVLGTGNNVSEIWETGVGADSIFRKNYGSSANTTGAGAVNLGDSTSTASGADSFVSGSNNTASNAFAESTGGNSVASGAYAIAKGRQNTASGTYAVAQGGLNSASGQGAVAQGDGNTASADFTFASGSSANASRIGQKSHSAGIVGSYYSQGTELFAGCSTTNATVTNLFLNGSSSRITIPSNTAVRLGARIIAVQEGGSSGAVGDMATWDILCTIKNVAGTTSIVDNVLYLDTAGAYQTTHHQSSQDAAASTWTIAVTADNTNDALDIQVTGQANKTILWHGVFYINEIKFGA